MRRAHWLTPNPRTMIPRHHVCIATTTRPVRGRPGDRELDCAALVYAEWQRGRLVLGEPVTYDDAADLWCDAQAILPARGVGWVWLLDPAQDLPALKFTGRVATGQFKRDWWVWADPPIIVQGKLVGRRVRMIGVPNWIDACNDAMPFRLGDVVCSHCSWKGLNCECKSPVLVEVDRCARLVQTIVHFVHREDLGHLCSTAGAQALQAYRHQYCPEKLLVDNHPDAIQLERAAATGFPIHAAAHGLVRGPIHVVDVNSLYPWVMRSYPYPRKRTYIGRCQSVTHLRDALAEHLCIARVSGDDPERAYCVRRQGRCVYTHQLDNDVLAGPELDSLASRGYCAGCHEVACYDAADLFSSWAQWAYDLKDRYKRRGESINLSLAKSIGVALWGKFGAAPGRWVDAPEQCPRSAEYGRFLWHRQDGTITECRAIAGVVDCLDGTVEPGNSVPSISAFVAAYARTYMRGLAAIAGQDNVLYQVADALHVTDAGLQRLAQAGVMDADRFGALKLVGSYDHAYYHGSNVYRLGKQWTWAGRAVAAVETTPGTWEWESPERLRQGVYHPQNGPVHMLHGKVSLKGADHV